MAKKKMTKKGGSVSKLLGLRNKNILIGALVLSLALAGGVVYYFQTKAAVDDSSCEAFATKHYRLACYAEKRVGIKESPAYSNAGSYVSAWNKNAGCNSGNPGDPWCASFVTSLMAKATGSKHALTCYTGDVVKYYADHHKVFTFNESLTLRKGDVLYRTRPSGGVGAGHVGIFVGYWKGDDGKTNLYVVEGNTKCDGVANDCVRKRTYNKDGSARNGDNKEAPRWEKVLRYND